jgi:hypothetical protein
MVERMGSSEATSDFAHPTGSAHCATLTNLTMRPSSEPGTGSSGPLDVQSFTDLPSTRTGRAERAWARLTGLTLGYGYQPWRALLFLVAVATIAVVLAVTLGAHGGVARTDPHPPAASRCSAVERVGVGLDLGLPLVKTGTRDHCDTTASTTGQVLTVAGWGLQLLAWAFATLFVAGFTGAVRKT